MNGTGKLFVKVVLAGANEEGSAARPVLGAVMPPQDQEMSGNDRPECQTTLAMTDKRPTWLVSYNISSRLRIR